MKRSITVVCVGAMLCAATGFAGESAPGGEPAQVAKEQPNLPAFPIWEFQVKGNTLLSQTAIELVLTPYLGPKKNQDAVLEAASQLERAYRDAGYPTVLVNFPDQKINEGVITLEVLEGKVARVRVSGSRYFLLSDIKQKVSSVEAGQPLHLPSFQSDLNRVNSANSNLRITPVLKPGRAPGTVEVDLRVKDELPLSASLEVNNHNSLNTTSTRAAANVSYENLWQKNHSISVQFQNAPEEPNESKVIAGTYILPLLDESTRMAIYAVNSSSEVSALSDLTVLGSGQIYGMRLVEALGSNPGYVHSLSLGMDWKDFDESVNLVGADGDNTPIKYGLLTTVYNGNFLGEHYTTRMGFSATLGLRDFLGGGDQEEFTNKRYYSRPNFFYVQLSLKHQQRFENDWRLNGRSKLQIADSALISNEQFSAGGADSVRGYYESQELGDNGVVASVELETPDFLESKAELRVRGFVDGAWLQLNDALSTDEYGDNHRVQTEDSLAGAGLGLDYRLKKYVTFSVDAGMALKEATEIEEGDVRVHASLVVDF